MDQTPNYGLPYPECDQPFVADASDVIQIRNLAEAVDTAVQGLSDLASQLLVHPDAARAFSTPLALGTGAVTAVIPYDQTNFDNTPGQTLTDNANGVLRIREDGWYWISHFVSTQRSGIGGDPWNYSRLWVNGAPGGAWSVITNNATVNPAVPFYNSMVTEVLRLNAGDTVTSQVWRIGTAGATGWSAEGRISILQILAA